MISFVQEVFGASSLVLSEEARSFKIENPSKTIEYTMISSNYHMEITPADNEYDDRHIIQKVVKDIASSNEINQKSQKKFKILVINEADRLSKEAQGSLRRTMEKYMSSCRMILVCKHIHKLIAPIRSRCVNLRIPAPSGDTIKSVLKEIARNECFDVSEEMLEKIAKVSGRNLRDAVAQLECFFYSKKTDIDLMHPFKPEVKEICKLITTEQSPAQLQKVRGIFYDLLVNCVEPNLILKLLLQEVVYSNKVKDEVLKGLIHKAAELESTMSQGSKAIVHLECFAAHAMEAVLETKESM